MIPKEVIDELKQSHPEAWAQKRAVLTEQQAAQVILAQIEIDQANPPHLELVATAKHLIHLANVKGAEVQRLKDEVIERIKALGDHAQLIDIELITATEDGDVSGLNKLLEEHRELIARQSERITELEADLKAAQDALQKKKK